MLKARLSKDAWRILCGVKDCGCELAFFQLESRADELRGRYIHPDDSIIMLFGAGWAQRADDGVWVLTRHAQRRVRRGQKPANRARPRRKTLGISFKTDTVGFQPNTLPAEAICPDCGFRQTLDPDVLLIPMRRAMAEEADTALDKGKGCAVEYG